MSTYVSFPLACFNANEGAMQPHEQHDPKPRKPDPQDKRTMWLLLVIAILLGLITTPLLDRLFF